MKWVTLLIALFGVISPVQAQMEVAPKKAPYSLRLLCVEADAQAAKLIVAEKTDKGWVARWRLSVSSAFMTEPLGFGSRQLALAIDPSPPPADGGFNGPATVVTEPLLVKPFREFELPDSDTVTAVMIASNKPEGSHYRVLLLDTQKQRFGIGKILVQNFTNETVAGFFGGKTAKLNAG